MFAFVCSLPLGALKRRAVLRQDPALQPCTVCLPQHRLAEGSAASAIQGLHWTDITLYMVTLMLSSVSIIPDCAHSRVDHVTHLCAIGDDRASHSYAVIDHSMFQWN